MTKPLTPEEIESLKNGIAAETAYWGKALEHNVLPSRLLATIDHLRSQLETATLGEAEAMLVLESTEQEVKRQRAKIERVEAVAYKWENDLEMPGDGVGREVYDAQNAVFQQCAADLTAALKGAAE